MLEFYEAYFYVKSCISFYNPYVVDKYIESFSWANTNCHFEVTLLFKKTVCNNQPLRRINIYDFKCPRTWP